MQSKCLSTILTRPRKMHARAYHYSLSPSIFRAATEETYFEKLNGCKVNFGSLTYCISIGLNIIFEAKEVILNSNLF